MQPWYRGLTRKEKTGARLLTSVAGLGFLPPWPGTWASCVPVVFSYLAFRFGMQQPLVVAILASGSVFFCLVTILFSGKVARAAGTEDPREVVSDEIAGQCVALLPAAGPAGFLVAFCAFRLFDVLKPYPIRRCERLPGGLGILADDLAAGLLAALVVLLWRLVSP